jgi:hypothetical protein
MSIARRLSNLVFAFSQAAIPALGYLGLFGQTVTSEAQTTKTPVVPADYAFAVWSVIFLLNLIYALDQMRPSRADVPVYRRIGWLTAAAFAANTVWSVVAQLGGPLVFTGLIFLVAAFGSVLAAWRTFRTADAPLVARLAVGSLAGWVAIFANWSVVLKDLGYGDLGGETLQALMFLSAAGLLAAATIRVTRGALPYALTIAWALIGLIVGNLERGTETAAIAAGLWLVTLAAGTVIDRGRTRREPLQAAD